VGEEPAPDLIRGGRAHSARPDEGRNTNLKRILAEVDEAEQDAAGEFQSPRVFGRVFR
jgi:hypothetical protein